MTGVRRGVIGPIVIGVIGTAVLLGLGAWQLQRLDWKERLIGEIEARLAAEPVAVPTSPEPARDQFLRVVLEGRLAEGPEGRALYRLTTKRPHGPGYQVIVPVALPVALQGASDARLVLADLGYIPEAMKGEALPPVDAPISLTGALFWPERTDSFTPPRDVETGVVFSRDVPVLAEALGTEPVLVVAERHDLGDWPQAERIAHNLPNDHFGYAMTWFGLAAVWAVMSVLWGRRAAG